MNYLLICNEDHYILQAILKYTKDGVPYQGKYMVYCVSPNKNIYLPKKV